MDLYVGNAYAPNPSDGSGRAIYYCNPDANVDPTAIGCVAGPSSVEICC